MRKLPAVLQALIDLAEPSTQEELEGYLDGQRKRIKRAGWSGEHPARAPARSAVQQPGLSSVPVGHLVPAVSRTHALPGSATSSRPQRMTRLSERAGRSPMPDITEVYDGDDERERLAAILEQRYLAMLDAVHAALVDSSGSTPSGSSSRTPP